MNIELLAEFDLIIADSLAAFQYAQDHFDELMNRRVVKILYGPPTYGLGAANPSRHVIPGKERILSNKTRRKTYTEYSFGEDNKLLYSREYDEDGLTSTLIHFWFNNINYSRYFFKDENAFYTAPVFSVKYVDGKATRYANATKHRLYVEYLQDIITETGDLKTKYVWYDYYPNRVVSKDGTPISRDASVGDFNSPISTGFGYFDLLKSNPLGLFTEI